MRKTLLAALVVFTAAALRAAAPQTPAAAAPAPSDVTALRFGKLWDGSKVMSDAVVVVQGDRVKSVGSGTSAIPAGARVVDL